MIAMCANACLGKWQGGPSSLAHTHFTRVSEENWKTKYISPAIIPFSLSVFWINEWTKITAASGRRFGSALIVSVKHEIESNFFSMAYGRNLEMKKTPPLLAVHKEI